MGRPSVNIQQTNGNLGIVAQQDFGVPVLVVSTPAAPTAGYSTPFSIKTKAQAEAAFANPSNAAVLAAIKDGFYAEAPEGKELFIVAVANTNQLTALAGAAIAELALNFAAGTGRLVAFVKFPDVSYTPTTTDGFDADVHTAVSAAQTLADAWLIKRKPFRALIQGYGYTDATAAKTYATDNKRNVAVVVGAINDSTAVATLLALGRAAKTEPQQNIGRIKSGSLVIDDAATVKLGAVLFDSISNADLDTLHTKRYITFDKNEIAPGYVFNDDNMLTVPTDDYNNLRHGRIIDNALRIAYVAYYEELKDDVFLDANGRLSKVVEKALETKIVTAIDQQMRGQLNVLPNGRVAVEVLVNPDTTEYAGLYAQNNISAPNLNMNTNGGVIYVFVRLQPKGCIKTINVYLALTATV